MKKQSFFLILCFSLLLQLSSQAQSKKKDEKEFLKQLNTVLKKSKQQQWAFEDYVMTIDSAFAISKKGILSVTVRYTNDSSFVRVRTTAPLVKIEKIIYDLYLILVYKENVVTFYKSEPNSMELKEFNTYNWFHIGAPLPEDIVYQEKLQKALDNLRPYYPE